MEVFMNRKFIFWWASVLLTFTLVYWSYHFGVIHTIWVSDVTMITSLISLIFLVTNLYLGWIVFRNKITSKPLETCWFISEQLMALGMLGTVIGLIHMLSNNFIGVTDETGLQNLLSNMWSAMGLALYTNAVGLVASIILKVQVYFIGRDTDEV